MSQPTPLSAATFRAKVLALQAQRGVQDLLRPVPTLEKQEEPLPHLVTELRTKLWREEDPREARNEQGKVQNLRVLARRLDGLLIPAGQTFSFWRQVGRTTAQKGYVTGRQIQEGCLIPARGGGICQLTNMLYEAVLGAGCEVLERHPHTRQVPGAPRNRPDATVAWNHIDLRFRAPFDLFLKSFLTPDELVLQLWSDRPGKRTPLPQISVKQPKSANSCASCGMETCFRHEERRSDGRRAMLVDRVWPEYAGLVSGHDLLLLPLDPRRVHRGAYAWPVEDGGDAWCATLETLVRSWRSRKLAGEGAARREASLEADEALARAYARRLTPDVTELTVYQQFLPFLQQDGHLGGRRYDVLMTRLPMAELQRRLDWAASLSPERSSLSDFRAPTWMIEAEERALGYARRIITPHTEIAALFGERAVLIPWQIPPPRPVQKGTALAFPGPAIARKGSEVVRNVARTLQLPVVLAGSDLEADGFWQGVELRRRQGRWLEGVACVVQPAVVEDQPRKLLEALACGLPVVATPACGIPPQDGLHLAAPEEFTETIRRIVSVNEATLTV